jgi:hypothetical protein
MGGTRDGVKPVDLGSNSGTRSLGPGTFFPSFNPDENLYQNQSQTQNHELSHSRGNPHYPVQESMYTTRGNSMPTANGILGNSGGGSGIGIIGGGAVRSIDGTCAVHIILLLTKIVLVFQCCFFSLIRNYISLRCCDMIFIRCRNNEIYIFFPSTLFNEFPSFNNFLTRYFLF